MADITRPVDMTHVINRLATKVGELTAEKAMLETAFEALNSEHERVRDELLELKQNIAISNKAGKENTRG